MPQHDRVRTRVAQEAARIMHEQGIREHDLARRKAARKLGVTASRSAPRDDEIDAALLEYQRIYSHPGQAETLQRLRQLAAEAMRFLAAYSPLLYGSVWEGTANGFSPIILHLFTEEAEEVHRKLADAGVPFKESEHSIMEEGRRQTRPAFHFYADGTRIELLVFPPKWRGKTHRRKGGQRSGGTLAEVAALLQSQAPDRTRL